MEYQTLELNIKNNLAVVVLSRPDVFNSMDALMRAELTEIMGDTKIKLIEGPRIFNGNKKQ